MAKVLSMEEVASHNSKKSTWIVIHGGVYDVTAFLSEHPGGDDALLDYAGKDGSVAFEDVGHSEDARELMKKFKIGELKSEDRKKTGGKADCKKCCCVPAIALGVVGAILIGILVYKRLKQ